MEKPSLNIVRSADIAAHSQEFSHPWNPNSELHGTQLARSVGLKRTGVNFIRVPAGKESYVYHSHQCEEEWIYVLAGHLRLVLGDQDWVLGAGEVAEFDTHLPHWFGSTGSEPAEILSIFARPGERMNVRTTPHGPS